MLASRTLIKWLKIVKHLVILDFLSRVILVILITAAQFCDDIWTEDINSNLYSQQKLKSLQKFASNNI